MKESKMSSAILEILDINSLEILGYGEYNGTSDSVPTEFVINYDEIKGQKPYFLKYNDCECDDKKYVKVYLFSNYGGGFYWPSEVCLKCKTITGITSPVEPDWGYSYPTIEQKRPYKELYDQGYPKDGDPRKRDE